MNTSTHAVISLAVLGKRAGVKQAWPILIGGLLPDVMMFVFFYVERFVFRHSQQMIWDERYFDATWQTIFDVLNAFPVLIVGWLWARWQRVTWLQWLIASMMLHALLDFPVHREDGHRHFWPLSDYRFMSPVSYWDPAHHGAIFSVIELLLLLGLSIYCYLTIPRQSIRIFLVVINALTFGMMVMFFIVFGLL